MPELPEVEVLVRRLAPELTGRRVNGVRVFRARSLRPTSPARFRRDLEGARFAGVARRGKYIVFTMESRGGGAVFRMLGHLGMTGRMFVRAGRVEPPRHAVVLLDLAEVTFVFEDTRYFGRLNFDPTPLESLGPEPFDHDFTPAYVHGSLRRSAQPVKVRLLDQSFIEGVGRVTGPSDFEFMTGRASRAAAAGRRFADWFRRDGVRFTVLDASDDHRGSAVHSGEWRRRLSAAAFAHDSACRFG